MHNSVPEHPPPDQPLNVELESGITESLTAGAWLYIAEHTVPQFIFRGMEVIVPEPAPDLLTVRRCGTVKVAMAERSLSITTVHGPAPAQPPLPNGAGPDQPTNSEPLLGIAVRITELPFTNFLQQPSVHFVPGGSMVTVPIPGSPGQVLVTATHRVE